jgi:hypothetical protein
VKTDIFKMPLSILAELLCTACLIGLSNAIKVGNKPGFKCCEACEKKTKDWMAR